MKENKELPTILLVEDNADDYEATIRSFQKVRLNNPVKWCKSGGDAINYLQKTGKYQNDPSLKKPSIILLDLNMPGLDGRKTLAIIKQDPELKSIPVLVLTTSADERDIETCYAAGASTYIQKPVSFSGLIEAVGRMKDYWFGVALLPQNTDDEST